MNSIRLLHLFLVFTVALIQAPRLTAQNDRSIAVNNVPALIANLAGTKPLKRQVEKTYSAEYFNTYSSTIDHVQGMARLANGNYVFSHSTYPNQEGLVVFSRPNASAVYRPFSLGTALKQSHPSGMQACGNIIAVPISDEVASVHFFDGTDPDNPVELTHLRVTYFENANKPLNLTIDAVGLVYHEGLKKHILSVSTGKEEGKLDGTLWIFQSNGKALTDPECKFTYHQACNTFTSAAGYNLLYDASDELYGVSTYRTSPGAEERLHLVKITLETHPTKTVSATEISDIFLSNTGIDISPSPGFRWGGGIVPTGPNSLEVIGSARLLTGGSGADYCVIKIWRGEGILEDCRKYADVSWLTSHKAFVAPLYGYPVDNNQSLDLNGQLAGGARAFTLDTWEKANLNAPSGGPAYNNLKDAMEEGKVYLLNDPRREPGVGGLLPGINWPTDLNDNVPKASFAAWLNEIGQYLLSHPTEIITLLLEGDASLDAHSSTLGELSGEILDLFMNQSDYDNLYFRSLGDMRSSGRRLAVLREGNTLDFNVNGRSFQFRRRFEKAVENTNALLPDGLNTCSKRPESADLDLIERLVIFNHWGQPFHEVIVRRWLDHCDYVNIPNFLVVNNVTDGSLGVQPKDAVNEFNRRLNDRMTGNSAIYRIIVAGSNWNITQESDEDDANAVTSDNEAEWEFIRNTDNSYFIRLKGTNRYLIAPLNGLKECYMTTDNTTNRARWYVEPLGGNTVRIYCKHEYAGITRKALRQVSNGAAVKLSDNIDFANVIDQKFELVPATFLNATCKSATVVLDQNGGANLLPDAIKEQINYSGVCQAELFVTVDKDFFTCADVGTHQVTLNASNGANLNASCTATVTVIDNSPTILECPPAQIISANDICKGVVGSWSPTRLEDNCVGNLTVTQSPTAIRALNGHNDSELVTLTANDGHGNLTQCSFTVTLKDITGPAITCKNATTHLDNNGTAVIGYGLVYQSGSDNCGDVNLESISKTIFHCADLGPNNVTVTANDGNGNTGTCTAMVTVVDNRAPSVVCKSYTAYLDAAGATSIVPSYVRQSSSDNCSVVNLVSVVPNAFNCSQLGENTVTLTVNDGNGNTATCTATVTVVDDIAPTVVCQPFTAYLNPVGAVTIVPNDVFQNGADNCSTVNKQAVVPSTFNCSNLGANTVTLTVNDGHGNSATCATTVTVVDNLAPTVVCKPFTAYLNAAGTVGIVSNDVFQNGADNCGSVNLASVAPNTFNCNNLGANTVVLTVNDGHNNTSSCNATVTVLDNIVPTVVCKTFTANLNAAGVISITPENVFQSGADNCGLVNLVSVSPSSFTCAQLGSNPVTLTVNDGHGNGASCNTSVTVKDEIIPTMLCKNATIYLNSAGLASISVAEVNNGSFDNCSITSMGLSQTTFACANAGPNTVILGGRDQSQNKGQCIATVTVIDAVLPTSKCKNLAVNLGVNGSVSVAPNPIDNGSFDNCTFTQTLTPNTFSCSNVGLNTVTLRSTDASGNTSTCTAIVTVKDVTAPKALCKNATIYLNDSGLATLNTSQLNNGSSDACGISTLTLSKTQFNCSDIPGSAQTVTLTLKDVNNNTSSCNAQVTTKDNLAPTAVCEHTIVELGANGMVTVYPQNLAADSYDNCSVWSYSPTAKVYTTANIGNNNLTITVKDWSGNASTCVSVVTVQSSNGFRGGGNGGEESLSTLTAGALPEEGINLTLFPNPSLGEASLQFDLPTEQSFSIRVYDSLGRLVMNREGKGQAGENTFPLNLRGFAAGVYVVDFQSECMKGQKRLLVQND